MVTGILSSGFWREREREIEKEQSCNINIVQKQDSQQCEHTKAIFDSIGPEQ